MVEDSSLIQIDINKAGYFLGKRGFGRYITLDVHKSEETSQSNHY